MARSDEDIFSVQLKLIAQVSLDRERIESDPVWIHICLINDAQVGVHFTGPLLAEYLQHYITRERFLSEMPCTNGPGSLSLQELNG